MINHFLRVHYHHFYGQRWRLVLTNASWVLIPLHYLTLFTAPHNPGSAAASYDDRGKDGSKTPQAPFHVKYRISAVKAPEGAAEI